MASPTELTSADLEVDVLRVFQERKRGDASVGSFGPLQELLGGARQVHLGHVAVGKDDSGLVLQKKWSQHHRRYWTAMWQGERPLPEPKHRNLVVRTYLGVRTSEEPCWIWGKVHPCWPL